MAPLPIRKMGAVGIIKDIAPFDLPPHAWTGGRNVFFAGGASRRAPAFRLLQDIEATIPSPSFITALHPASSVDTIYLANTSGQVWQYVVGTGLTDVTAAGFVPGVHGRQFTSAILSGVLYINRESHGLRYLNSSTGKIEDLPGWPSTYRANLVRSFKDFLFTFGITKGASESLTTFKWSNAVKAGLIPDTWDPEIIEDNLAGETTLAEMNSPFMDAAQLRDILVAYGTDQVWGIEFTGDKAYPFAQRKLFNEGGAISRNCVVEVNGQHYVFGSDDIYMHDGIAKKSLAEGRIRSFIYSTMNRSKASRFFVHHDRINRNILFCYVSQDADTVFTSTEFPNKALIYNYTSDTLGFAELPNVPAMTTASAAISPTWATVTAAWDGAGGTWGDLDDGKKPITMTVCGAAGAVDTARIHVLDGIDNNSRISASLDTQANTLGYLERVGIDLDEVQAPLPTFKLIAEVCPQIRTYRSLNLNVKIGGASFQQTDPVYEAVQTFNPQADYACDAMAPGRYMSIRIDEAEVCDFEVSGMDLDIQPNGDI